MGVEVNISKEIEFLTFSILLTHVCTFLIFQDMRMKTD